MIFFFVIDKYKRWCNKFSMYFSICHKDNKMFYYKFLFCIRELLNRYFFVSFRWFWLFSLTWPRNVNLTTQCNQMYMSVVCLPIHLSPLKQCGAHHTFSVSLLNHSNATERIDHRQRKWKQPCEGKHARTWTAPSVFPDRRVNCYTTLTILLFKYSLYYRWSNATKLQTFEF